MAQGHETAVAPMAGQQWRPEPAQDARHKRRMFLLFFDEQINGRRELRIAGGSGVRAQVCPLAALSNLKTLQGVDQWPPKRVIDSERELPRNWRAVATIT